MATKARLDLVFSAVIVALIALAVWEARDWSIRAKLFPWVIGFPVLALAVVQLALAGRALAATSRLGPEQDQGDLPRGELGLAAQAVPVRTAQIVLWTLFFFVAILVLNFKWASLVATLVFLKVAARERWLLSLLLSLATFLIFHLVFDQVLHIPFGRGMALELLGLDPPL